MRWWRPSALKEKMTKERRDETSPAGCNTTKDGEYRTAGADATSRLLPSPLATNVLGRLAVLSELLRV
jgi:hypothetical protein